MGSRMSGSHDRLSIVVQAAAQTHASDPVTIGNRHFRREDGYDALAARL